MSHPLRDYQTRAIELLKTSIVSGKRRPILQLPTGAGKTRIAAEIIRGARAKANRVIFVVPRISLIEQTVAAFEREGIKHFGVIQGQHFRTDAAAAAQIVSAQTLARRAIPDADLVVIDECHLQFKSIQDWINDPGWSEVIFIGLTATPWAKGLGKYYDDLIRPVSISELIDAEHLSPFRVFAPPEPDLTGVRITAGDYNEADLSEACDTKELIGNIVSTWIERGENRPTLCYGVDRKHAQHLQERFIEAGVTAEYIDCDTPLFEREDIFARFQSSETKLICNVSTLDTGIDLDCRCLIDARPTKSRIRFVQTIGRSLRPAEGKDHCIILDHAGNHKRLGLVTEIDADQLDDGTGGKSYDRAKSDKEPFTKTCTACHFVLPPRVRACPSCGEALPAVTGVIEKEGELVEFGTCRSGRKSSYIDEPLWHGALVNIANRKGYSSGLGSTPIQNQNRPLAITEIPGRKGADGRDPELGPFPANRLCEIEGGPWVGANRIIPGFKPNASRKNLMRCRQDLGWLWVARCFAVVLCAPCPSMRVAASTGS